MSDPASTLNQKISCRFEKTGMSRFYSHHDIMRYWERTARRADLPLRLTEGFNPKPRMVFPHPLGLGVSSSCEEIEIELTQKSNLKSLEAVLAEELSPLLRLVSIIDLPAKRKGRVVSKCVYEIGPWPTSVSSCLKEALGKFQHSSEIKMSRGIGHKRRDVNIMDWIESAEVLDDVLQVTLMHNAKGAGRPDEICRWFADELTIEWQNIGIVKTAMVFRD